MYPRETKLKLVSSASEQNVYFTYVCTVNSIKPSAFERGQNQSSFSDLRSEEEVKISVYIFES